MRGSAPHTLDIVTPEEATPVTSTDNARRIDAAAALLNAAGRADTNPGTRIHCLLAAEHLRGAGADPSRWTDIGVDAVEHVIRTALMHLAALPPDVFARTEILDAASAARTALTRTEEE
jgi:hypothetical protein